MQKEDVKHLLKIIIPEYDTNEHDVELNELLAKYAKGMLSFHFVNLKKCVAFNWDPLSILASKYTVHNKQTNRMEVKHREYFYLNANTL